MTEMLLSGGFWGALFWILAAGTIFTAWQTRTNVFTFLVSVPIRLIGLGLCWFMLMFFGASCATMAKDYDERVTEREQSNLKSIVRFDLNVHDILEHSQRVNEPDLAESPSD